MEGIGFVQAGCLEEGYELKCLDGGRETITEVRVEWPEEAITVYNFEVADYHTYFVGDGDVLVHNMDIYELRESKKAARTLVLLEGGIILILIIMGCDILYVSYMSIAIILCALQK